ncbi:hypothetical protein GF412_04080 [Candidatus Micrarchaeota archaeon]|nr:hypothetical protein [Candidatus Micrarchaeota archaeon]MBD3418128.1 hypothetical protein [Candidatus Micrarchaeota archaeon]
MGGKQKKEPAAAIALPPVLGKRPRAPPPGKKLPPDRMPGKKAGPSILVDESIEREGSKRMVVRIARALSSIHPECMGSEIQFRKDAVLLNSKKIGDVSVDVQMVKVRIWFNNLGYPLGSLGPEELGHVFEIDPAKFQDAMGQGNYLVLMGLHQETLSHIGLSFYKDFKTRVRPPFPLKQK